MYVDGKGNVVAKLLGAPSLTFQKLVNNNGGFTREDYDNSNAYANAHCYLRYFSNSSEAKSLNIITNYIREGQNVFIVDIGAKFKKTLNLLQKMVNYHNKDSDVTTQDNNESDSSGEDDEPASVDPEAGIEYVVSVGLNRRGKNNYTRKDKAIRKTERKMKQQKINHHKKKAAVYMNKVEKQNKEQKKIECEPLKQNESEIQCESQLDESQPKPSMKKDSSKDTAASQNDLSSRIASLEVKLQENDLKLKASYSNGLPNLQSLIPVVNYPKITFVTQPSVDVQSSIDDLDNEIEAVKQQRTTSMEVARIVCR